MKNQSVSDFVAATMQAVLNSKEHKSLFATQYKKAGDSMCAEHGKMDSCAADDQDAKKKKDSDESSAWDDNDARKAKKKDEDDDSCMADDDENDARKSKKKDSDEEDSDESDADDNYDDYGKGKPSGSGVGNDPLVFPTDKITAKPPTPPPAQKADDGLETSAAFDVAIDSLLTASAALDSVGLGRGSALTLKIASLVVEAKKKDKKEKDSKKKDSKKDSQSAKDKKSDKKDSKKDDKKSDKKDSHSAKDKKSDKKDDKKSSKDSKKSSK